MALPGARAGLGTQLSAFALYAYMWGGVFFFWEVQYLGWGFCVSIEGCFWKLDGKVAGKIGT